MSVGQQRETAATHGAFLAVDASISLVDVLD